MESRRAAPLEEGDPGVIEYDGGMRLTGTALWLDARRPVPLSFVSHALVFRHHQRLVTSSETVALLSDKLGSSDALASPLGRRFSLGELQLELVPAGHIVGSAQLLVEHRGLSLLYCGAVRQGPGWLGAPGQSRQADVLVLDCPYDAVPYQFPGRAQTAADLMAWVKATIDGGDSPVVVASELGMAQEACHLLRSEGVPTRAHRIVADWNRRVRACGVPLVAVPELRHPLAEGEAAVVPPRAVGSPPVKRLAPRARFALVSGEAVVDARVEQAGAEVGFALSCHSDARALRELVRDSGADHVYLGPRHTKQFETVVRRMGKGVTRFEARADQSQLELFQPPGRQQSRKS